MKTHNSTISLRPLLLIVCLALLLGGCVSAATPIQYASSGPPEKKSTLKVISTLTVTRFDGETVEWKASSGDYWASVQIPEGAHTFMLDYKRFTSHPETHYGGGIPVSYTFIAGHTYELVAGEGAEPGGFSGLFTNMIGAMVATVNKELRIGIRDITANPNGDFEWLTPGHAGN